MWTAPSELKTVLDRARQQNHQIVLVTGVFDILHQEHKAFLEKAKAQGDVLVVGIETDQRVKELKGAGRPINNQDQRIKQLQAWKLADQVFVLPAVFHSQADYVNLIEVISPHILAVSSHSPYLENKQKVMAQFGGKVVIVHEHNPAISTTQILAAQTSTDVLR